MDILNDVFRETGLFEDNSESVEKMKIEGAENGLDVIVDIETDEKKKQERIDAKYIIITDIDRQQAVDEAVIPKVYKQASFDKDRIKENLKIQYNKNKLYKIKKFERYISVCFGILNTFRTRQMLDRSWLIGAPNGFGKNSFVTECLITLRCQGYKVVPYISLLELAQLRVEYERIMMEPYKYKYEEKEGYGYSEPREYKAYMKEPEAIVGRFSFMEYVNADCLFVHFTDVISKEVESHMLYQLLSMRGAKGLPTVVMISTSLEPYTNDINLRTLVWDEILTPSRVNEEDKTFADIVNNSGSGSFDRLTHVSTYKQRKSNLDIDNRGQDVDPETGVID